MDPSSVRSKSDARGLLIWVERRKLLLPEPRDSLNFTSSARLTNGLFIYRCSYPLHPQVIYVHIYPSSWGTSVDRPLGRMPNPDRQCHIKLLRKTGVVGCEHHRWEQFEPCDTRSGDKEKLPTRIFKSFFSLRLFESMGLAVSLYHFRLRTNLIDSISRNSRVEASRSIGVTR